jgi:hypothetical protein
VARHEIHKLQRAKQMRRRGYNIEQKMERAMGIEPTRAALPSLKTSALVRWWMPSVTSV